MGDIVQFNEDHLATFAAASGDRNPLHLSSEYASRTPYGERVVFGALGAVVALGHVPDAIRVNKLRADFLRPMFLRVQYEVRIVQQAKGVLVRLFDGAMPVLGLAVEYNDAEPEPQPNRPPEPVFDREEAADRPDTEVVAGLGSSGSYRTDESARVELCRTWNVTASPVVVDAMLWSSYAVGMHVPGRIALFSRLTLEFTGKAPPDGLFDYAMTVRDLDTRMGMARITARLRSKDGDLAAGECVAFVRSSAPEFNRELLERDLPRSQELAGKIALVAGASRGLGAALAHALASQGATVVAASRSIPSTGLTESNLSSTAANVGDSEALSELGKEIVGKYGHLDIVVANAFPAILPLTVDQAGISRIRDYMTRATDLVLAPLTAFAGLLSASRGAFVLISSEAASRPVKQWPHYVAAKRAAEALTEVASLQHPSTGFLIVRPQKLLTEMTNTPVGRIGATPPERVAAQIIQRLNRGLTPGTCELFEPGNVPT